MEDEERPLRAPLELLREPTRSGLGSEIPRSSLLERIGAQAADLFCKGLRTLWLNRETGQVISELGDDGPSHTRTPSPSSAVSPHEFCNPCSAIHLDTKLNMRRNSARSRGPLARSAKASNQILISRREARRGIGDTHSKGFICFKTLERQCLGDQVQRVDNQVPFGRDLRSAMPDRNYTLSLLPVQTPSHAHSLSQFPFHSNPPSHRDIPPLIDFIAPPPPPRCSFPASQRNDSTPSVNE